MEVKFEIGDKVAVNPSFNNIFKGIEWWEEGRRQTLTIKKEVFKGLYSVEEYNSWWKAEWLLKVEKDFFKEEEFEV